MNKYARYLRYCSMAVLIVGGLVSVMLALMGIDWGEDMTFWAGVMGCLLTAVLYYALLAYIEILNNSEKQTRCLEKLTEHFCGKLPEYEEIKGEEKDE